MKTAQMIANILNFHNTKETLLNNLFFGNGPHLVKPKSEIHFQFDQAFLDQADYT